MPDTRLEWWRDARFGMFIHWGLYDSMMDWHHPDYLPRREWELASRPEAGADVDRYVTFMKGQLKELLTKYGPVERKGDGVHIGLGLMSGPGPAADDVIVLDIAGAPRVKAQK